MWRNYAAMAPGKGGYCQGKEWHAPGAQEGFLSAVRNPPLAGP